MPLGQKQIKEILLNENYVTPENVTQAEKFASVHHINLSDALIQLNFLDKKLLGQALAEFLKMPFADLEASPPEKVVILKIPEDLAKKNTLLLFKADARKFVVACSRPPENSLVQILRKLLKAKQLSFVFALPEEITPFFLAYQSPLTTRLKVIMDSSKQVAPELLDEIFQEAITLTASDIHFEPQKKAVCLRFRVDGVLQEVGQIPTEYYENLLNRIKILSHLRIDEHFAPQDGSLRYENKEVIVDIRTSIIPTVEGEKIVLRLLSSYVRALTLNELGLTPKDQSLLEEASQKPFGMILVTGPTGSGKTTTLYALIHLLNEPTVNITTIEDPVEYKLQGINQIQVSPKNNLSFATGLRSIVRQDPDIILVGEIRDEETADISVNAALTGHLLLSTFHANNAATAIPRLIEMNIEPFLLASTLELVLAQRLVRQLCQQCLQSLSLQKKDLKGPLKKVSPYFVEKTMVVYGGKGCTACHHSGYKGRTSIYEVIRITPEMRELILTHPSSQTIWNLAQKQGSLSLFEDGLEKVKKGLTSLEELLRVAEPPAPLNKKS